MLAVGRPRLVVMVTVLLVASSRPLLSEAPVAVLPVGIDPPFVHETRLEAGATAQPGALLGESVSVSGETVVVGAPFENTAAGADAGAAYVYVRSGTMWSLQQRLVAPDGAADDRFGLGVAISGDSLVVGAERADTPAGSDAGAAYVFVRTGTTWSQQQKLTAVDGAVGENFGRAVAAYGETVAVGAPGDAGSVGAAYVFVRSGATWSPQQKLVASDGQIGDFFGRALAAAESTVVVGADFADTPRGTAAGAAYVFERSGAVWNEQQKLAAADGAANDLFGWSVSVSGDTAVIGALNGDAPAGSDRGSAYVFVRSGAAWSEQQELVASDGAPSDSFGFSVSLSAGRVAVGAPFDDTPAGLDAGSTYVFVRSGGTWSEQQKLAAPDAAAGDRMGVAVAMSGSILAAGADADDTAAGGADAGSAGVYRLSGTRYFAVAPCRLVDTRLTASPLLANSTRTFPVTGLCDVTAEARALAVILTVANPGDTGNLRLFPAGAPLPLASAISFAAGRTRANNAIIEVGAGGGISVRCDMPAGSGASTHFVLDVSGYFR